MRFLKTKIRLCQEALNNKTLASKDLTENPSTANSPAATEDSTHSTSEDAKFLEIYSSSPNVLQDSSTTDQQNIKPSVDMKSCSDTKNLSINYGKAIVRFASSPLAFPYLQAYFEKENQNTSLSEFTTFMKQLKNHITGIEKFRSLLLVTNEDSPQIAICKQAFRHISEVFIKYFSVSWIMHGKIGYKLVYLKYRSKMLRRIRNPEFFTYVRNDQRQKQAKKQKNSPCDMS